MKQLLRNKKTGKIAGVCSGIAEYFGVDPVFIRILFVISIFLKGFGFIAYVAAWIIMPEQTTEKAFIEGEKRMPAVDSSIKSRLGALLFCGLLGWIGVHRFYAGKTGTGILMILTLGGLGIWWIIDAITILIGSFKDKDGKYIVEWMPQHARNN